MGNIGRLLALLLVALQLAGCGSLAGYYRDVDAPEYIKAGGIDPRLCLTRRKGDRVSIALRDAPRTRGKLLKTADFRERFISQVQPLDVVVVRSPAGLTRDTIPSFFTHLIVWLGTKQQLQRAGVWNSPVLAPYRKRIEAGETIIEASYENVHFSVFEEGLSHDHAVILRSKNRNRSGKLAIYRKLFDRLGVPFDTSFDQKDPKKLTCLELVEEIYPEIKLPVRYVYGRFALMPDDLVRETLEGRLELRFATHFTTDRKGDLVELPSDKTEALLTAVKEKPPFSVF